MTGLKGGGPVAQDADRLPNSLAASERERSRWARELHDRTLQSLGAVRLQLAAARRGSPQSLAPAVEAAIADLAEQIADLRTLIAELHPVALEELGLATALESLVHHHRDAGLDVVLNLSAWRVGEHAERLDPELESILFRISQEALANVAAHADATRVELWLRRSVGDANLIVRDDGRGFDPSTKPAGLVLLALEERIAMAGGALRVESSPGAGTTVHARVPLPVSNGSQLDSSSSSPRSSA